MSVQSVMFVHYCFPFSLSVNYVCALCLFFLSVLSFWSWCLSTCIISLCYYFCSSFSYFWSLVISVISFDSCVIANMYVHCCWPAGDFCMWVMYANYVGSLFMLFMYVHDCCSYFSYVCSFVLIICPAHYVWPLCISTCVCSLCLFIIYGVFVRYFWPCCSFFRFFLSVHALCRVCIYLIIAVLLCMFSSRFFFLIIILENLCR